MLLSIVFVQLVIVTLAAASSVDQTQSSVLEPLHRAFNQPTNQHTNKEH
jgi:hypothetical protein